MYIIKINGIVQGVGFRPFIYKLALEEDINGFVLNSTSGVQIEAEGKITKLKTFISRIKSELPPAAEINKFEVKLVPDKKYNAFEIKISSQTTGSTLISPDLAVCNDCINEFNNPSDPRFQYPFINCTNCGPRFSIIENTPYDRPVTSMKDFKMCSFCDNEYKNPLNRRFHAQPIACEKCGPKLIFQDKKLFQIDGSPIKHTIEALQRGKIVGIKGIGGFHIACDAKNFKAVSELRKRKHRPHKPFAIMVLPDRIKDLVHINNDELKILKSSVSPIIILPQKENNFLAENVAPDNPNLGIFFPYAPHHYQILSKELPFLIMTSGNKSNEPIAKNENELIAICDCFLTHNRPILNRSDDSIIMPIDKKNIIIRRSRGYVPTPLTIPIKTIPTLGCGAELKLTFSLSEKNKLFLSPYIGNSGSKETIDFYLEIFEKYKKWFKIDPELIACDLQPDFATTRFAEETGLPIQRIQHHHAHIAAVMAEHQLDEQVIGISYDGTGYGTDQKIWGGEIFIADYNKFERVSHLEYMPLPGGDAAIKHPIRIAYSYLLKSSCDPNFLTGISDFEKNIIQKQLQNNFNVFQTSSMGRLFDSVAAMLELFPIISFEAQSAMALEYLCKDASVFDYDPYPYELDVGVIKIGSLLKSIYNDVRNKVNHSIIALRFHRTIIDFTLNSVIKASKSTGIKKVVLSGGVMQNRVILSGLYEILQRNNFTVFFPSKIPPNDSSISFGQVMIANRLLR
ncbi:MAG: carbamoyltransferase HypF [Candidatus Cloacimonetes bacterium]|nr:carbamoyltransferase HypF [Candidatus Cloacimonadota bacterium]